jgi:ribosomal protein S18 acetylase RimI-like enzyme
VPTLADRAHRNLCDFYRWLPRLYSGRLLDRDGIVAVTAELDWPVNRTAVRSAGTDATAWADATEAFLFADGRSACVYARVGTDDDITQVLTVRGFAEMTTLPEMVCEAVLERRADPAGFRVRLAESTEDVRGYAAVAGEAFAHLAIPADWLEATLTNPDALLVDNVAIAVAERDDGTVVAGAMSIVLGDEPNGYISWVACADSARGHGLGDAVTRLATNAGFDRGAQLLTLEASPFGRNTYRRMGYRELYDYRLLIKM